MSVLLPSNDIDISDYTHPDEDGFASIEHHQEDGESDEMDTEEALENLSQYDNVTQLSLLKKEIVHMVVHGVLPDDEWYSARFKNIKTYSEINWSELIRKFHGKDQNIHDTALKIIKRCDDLIEECSTKPNFHLLTYYRLILEIDYIWEYYHSKYLGDDQDDDVVDLIEGMSHLMG